MNSLPLVSVILPTYKPNMVWLSLSIDSVLKQTYKNLELIIIHEEPSIESEKKVKELLKKDKRIIYVKNEKKMGIAVSLNKGIFLSRGIYIARIDDDDQRGDVKKLEKQVDFMENHPKYGICGVSLLKNIDEKGAFLFYTSCKKTDNEIRDIILQCNQFAHPGILIRKDALIVCGIYNTSYVTAQDYELRCRIGQKFKMCNIDSWINYRHHSDSISSKKRFLQTKNAFKVFRKNRKYYPAGLRTYVSRIVELFLSTSLMKHIINLVKGNKHDPI